MKILLWCPGRVGSRSLLESMKKAKLDVVDIHTLERGIAIDRIPNVLRADVKLKNRAKEILQERAKIIVPIREPMGRNLSSWFCPWHHRQYKTKGETNLAALSLRFQREFPHNWLANWFDNEIRVHTGIDVYNYDFDGCIRIEDKHDLIIVDYRKINDVLAGKIEKWWGLKLNVGRVKGTSSSQHSQYQEFYKKITFPRTFVESVYNTKYARHFYSSERAELIKKWCG